MNRWYFLIIVVLVSLVGYVFGGIFYDSFNLTNQSLWKEIQQWRHSEGLPYYTLDKTLCEWADKRLDDIKQENPPTHKSFYERLNLYPYKGEMGENLSWGIASETKTLEGWLNSPSHAKLLRKDYEYSCIKTHGTLAVQLFFNYDEK